MIWERFSLKAFYEDQIFMKTLLSQDDFFRVITEPLQQLLDMEIPSVYTGPMNYIICLKPESVNSVRKYVLKYEKS